MLTRPLHRLAEPPGEPSPPRQAGKQERTGRSNPTDRGRVANRNGRDAYRIRFPSPAAPPGRRAATQRSPPLERIAFPFFQMMLILGAAGGLRRWTGGGCLRMLSCSPPTCSATAKDELLFLEARGGKKPIKAKGKAEVKAAGAVSALGSCRRVAPSSDFAPLPWQLSQGTYPSPAPRGLTLTEIQLQPLIEVDKLASARFRNH